VSPEEHDYSDVWFCVDCMVKAVNDEDPTDAREGDPVPLSLIEAGTQLSANFGDPEDPDADSGEVDFSARICDGCGSRLAGSRFRFALWTVTA
jgi:hypothetical protein